ncbi:hypothetical protein DRF60_20585 [Chryseobacterium elymi]|uniref:C1q domain-containing protein n=1 Tax=Chryseobacterium elymi TaxID=395936 RepID=A0A3D9D0J0_9FLAO|nr:hypothetical protein [Chryseobacterium elymi]REC71515.1 hypothetical protein DRF60_20585 [Chryseobacterium elymi]
MKKNILVLIAFLISAVTYSQVGINTENPQGIFHIDGQKDNPNIGVPATAQQLNDFVVTPTGNVGVGSISPSEKLEVKGNISLSSNGSASSSIKFYENNNNGNNKIIVKSPETFSTDRTITLPSNPPVNGYVLTTDGLGNTSWGAVNPSSSTLASIALKGSGPTVSVTNGNVAGSSVNQRFFQSFDTVVTDPNSAFNLSTGTYTAPQAGNYLITAYIVPNSSPTRNTSADFFYPINLEVRKNAPSGNPNGGITIMDSSIIRWATKSQSVLRFSIPVSGMVSLSAGDTLNLVVYLNGINAAASDTSGTSFPANITYAVVADFKALFSVTAL